MKRILSTITLAFLVVAVFAQTRDEVHHIITSDSVELYVHVKGQGEPCLYLHVGPDSYKALHFLNAIVRVGDCGHFPFLESPQEWSSALDDFNKITISYFEKNNKLFHGIQKDTR